MSRWVAKPGISQLKVTSVQWRTVSEAEDPELFRANGVPLTEDDKRKLAVLMMLQPGDGVRGVGQRAMMHKDAFFIDDGEEE